MNLQKILDQYERLGGQILELLQRERSALKAGNPGIFEQTADHRKRLLNELSEVVGALKDQDPSISAQPYTKSTLIRNIQHKFTKILKMDREVEKLYLACSRMKGPETLKPGMSTVRQAYGSARPREI